MGEGGSVCFEKRMNKRDMDYSGVSHWSGSLSVNNPVDASGAKHFCDSINSRSSAVGTPDSAAGCALSHAAAMNGHIVSVCLLFVPTCSNVGKHSASTHILRLRPREPDRSCQLSSQPSHSERNRQPSLIESRQPS